MKPVTPVYLEWDEPKKAKTSTVVGPDVPAHIHANNVSWCNLTIHSIYIQIAFIDTNWKALRKTTPVYADRSKECKTPKAERDGDIICATKLSGVYDNTYKACNNGVGERQRLIESKLQWAHTHCN